MRALGWFWGAVAIVLVGGAGTLQWLGAPHAPAMANVQPMHVAVPKPVAPTAGIAAAVPDEDTATAPTTAITPLAIRAPDPDLLEPSAIYPGGMLPRIGPDGRRPMRVYAARAEPPDARPRVALLLSGIGMSETDSMEAIRATPAAVSLAVSPYSFRPERLLLAARMAGHETFLSLPLEPDRYPIDDPGNRALLTGNTPGLNDQRLEWALTRFAGYVGATGALGGMRGERFGGAPELMAPLLRELASRGLMYVDPRPGAPPPPLCAGRGVDVVVDEPAVRTTIEANLARLEQAARDHGSALGLVGEPRPVTLDRIAAWASTLASRGIVLVPASALARPPPPKVPRETAEKQAG
jgi:polysaccharide deacetylase 2 family uncharacterized protein YibQ